MGTLASVFAGFLPIPIVGSSLRSQIILEVVCFPVEWLFWASLLPSVRVIPLEGVRRVKTFGSLRWKSPLP